MSDEGIDKIQKDVIEEDVKKDGGGRPGKDRLARNGTGRPMLAAVAGLATLALLVGAFVILRDSDDPVRTRTIPTRRPAVVW